MKTRKPKPSLIVEQYPNPRFDDTQSVHQHNNAAHIYRVVSAIDTVDDPLGSWLTPLQVQHRINNGISVTIRHYKDK